MIKAYSKHPSYYKRFKKEMPNNMGDRVSIVILNIQISNQYKLISEKHTFDFIVLSLTAVMN